MPDTKTASAVPHINRAVFDARCAELGATTEEDRARLIGVDRATLWRWTAGVKKPSLDAISNACTTLDLTRDALFPTPGTVRVQSIEEAAAKVAANWPALTEVQKDELSRIFAPIIRAENITRAPKQRRAA